MRLWRFTRDRRGLGGHSGPSWSSPRAPFGRLELSWGSPLGSSRVFLGLQLKLNIILYVIYCIFNRDGVRACSLFMRLSGCGLTRDRRGVRDSQVDGVALFHNSPSFVNNRINTPTNQQINR